jgi:chromosome segregation ATPase
MNLKDFRPDLPDFNEDEEQPEKKSDMGIEAPAYDPDINHVKIEKLSKKITLISVLLPCLLAIIIFFAYLDMRGKLSDANFNKQTEVEKISHQFQEQLSALDVKAEKNRFDLESMDKKTVGMESQIAKLTTSKADNAGINDQLTKLDTRVANNSNQNKLMLQSIERVNKELLSSQTKIQTELNQDIRQMKEELSSFKKGLDSKLAALGNYDQQLGELQKDVSLMDKKLKKMEQDSLSQAKLDEKIKFLREDLNAGIIKLDKQVQNLDLKLTTNLSRLQKDLDNLNTTPSQTSPKIPASEPLKPKPQVNIDSSNPGTIKQKSLTD